MAAREVHLPIGGVPGVWSIVLVPTRAFVSAVEVKRVRGFRRCVVVVVGGSAFDGVDFEEAAN
jgi:hypothetical protein